MLVQKIIITNPEIDDIVESFIYNGTLDELRVDLDSQLSRPTRFSFRYSEDNGVTWHSLKKGA